MKNKKSFNFSYRIYLLAFIVATIFILYWSLVSFFTLRFCWESTLFWYSQDSFISPYLIFQYLIYVFFLWCVLELFVIFRSNSLFDMTSIYIIAILIFLIAFSFVHYRLYQTLQATRGELYFYDIWPDAGNVVAEVDDHFYLDIISRSDYLYQRSCEAGFDPHDLEKDTRDLIFQDYQKILQIKEDIYAKNLGYFPETATTIERKKDAD